MVSVDFADLRQKFSIDSVSISLLELILKPSGATLRGRCPICKSAGERDLILTPAKGLFHCFKCKAGGSAIDLVAQVRGIGLRDAALAIAEHFGEGTVPRNRTNTRDSTGTVPTEDRAGQLQKILDRLEPEHEVVQGLGISAATARAWESGYNGSGSQRGRYSCPIRSLDGTLIAFVGIAVAPEQSPRILFPNGFDPTAVIFNAQHVEQGGELFLARSPMDAILAVEHGVPITNVVSFLTDTVNGQQLEMLSSLMDEKKIEGLEIT